MVELAELHANNQPARFGSIDAYVTRTYATIDDMHAYEMFPRQKMS
jgi:hypothetical protein